MPNFRDYETAWISSEGAEYRKNFYERQRAGGTKPLLDNPTVSEVIIDLEKHKPQSILEIGCGFGRLLEPISNYFCDVAVAGCDVSKEMLDLCPEELETFRIDICRPLKVYEDFFSAQWQVAFCKGVFMYFDRHQIREAMQTASSLVRKKILVYEWPFVCKRMIDVLPPDLKWEYHELLEKEE